MVVDPARMTHHNRLTLPFALLIIGLIDRAKQTSASEVMASNELILHTYDMQRYAKVQQTAQMVKMTIRCKLIASLL